MTQRFCGETLGCEFSGKHGCLYRTENGFLQNLLRSNKLAVMILKSIDAILQSGMHDLCDDCLDVAMRKGCE